MTVTWDARVGGGGGGGEVNGGEIAGEGPVIATPTEKKKQKMKESKSASTAATAAAADGQEGGRATTAAAASAAAGDDDGNVIPRVATSFDERRVAHERRRPMDAEVRVSFEEEDDDDFEDNRLTRPSSNVSGAAAKFQRRRRRRRDAGNDSISNGEHVEVDCEMGHTHYLQDKDNETSTSSQHQQQSDVLSRIAEELDDDKSEGAMEESGLGEQRPTRARESVYRGAVSRRSLEKNGMDLVMSRIRQAEMEIDSGDDDDDTLMEDWEGPENIYALILYKMLSKKTTRFEAALWLLTGLLASFCSVFSLIAICATLQWGGCSTEDDCKSGQACIRFIHPSGTLNTPTCEDCSFLTGPEAWEHRMPPLSDANSADGLCTNASQRFYLANDLDLIYADGSTPVPDEYPSFCLYVYENSINTSRLGIFILVVVTAVISGEMGSEAQQQARNRRIREYCMPFMLPRQSKKSWRRFGVTCAVIAMEIFQKLTLAMMPMTFAMLTITNPVNPVNIILDGLAITFFLLLDDLIPKFILTAKGFYQLKAYMGQFEQFAMRADTWKGKKNKWDGWTHVLFGFVACLLAFYGAKRSDNCEHLYFWLNYRITVQFGVWFTSLFLQLMLLGWMAKSWYAEQRRLRSTRAAFAGVSMPGRKKSWSVLRPVIVYAITWFSYTLLVAFVQNCMFTFAEWLAYSNTFAVHMHDYFWLETKDVFGTCASISWDASMPCAAPWPYPGEKKILQE